MYTGDIRNCIRYLKQELAEVEVLLEKVNLSDEDLDRFVNSIYDAISFVETVEQFVEQVAGEM